MILIFFRSKYYYPSEISSNQFTLLKSSFFVLINFQITFLELLLSQWFSRLYSQQNSLNKLHLIAHKMDSISQFFSIAFTVKKINLCKYICWINRFLTIFRNKEFNAAEEEFSKYDGTYGIDTKDYRLC